MKNRIIHPEGKVKILVVEDSPTQAQQLANLLENRGYEVLVSTNGKEALALLSRNHKPDLVISDIVMPEMDGYELCRQIKEDELIREIPVILATALSEPKDVIKGLECGADNFVIKPYEEEFLLSRIHYILINRTMRQKERVQMALQVSFAGDRYMITSDRLQILNLLLSTYEAAVQKNLELASAHKELQRLNEELEEIVKGRTASLTERIKELRCLYGISSLTQRMDDPLDEIIGKAVDLIPKAFHYQEIACARIVINGQPFATENFRETTWRLSSPIQVNGNPCCNVEVYYLEERPESDEGPFFREERDLIDDVARQLSGFLEYREAQQKLQHVNRVLHAIRKINQLIVQEKDRDRLIQNCCDDLISTRGYFKAWIALLDETGKIVTIAKAGVDKELLLLENLMKNGALPYCGKKALEQQGVVIIEDPASTCKDCPLANWYAGRVGIACRLEHGGRVYGILNVSGPAGLMTDEEEIGLVEEIASDIALGLSNIEMEEKRRQAEEALCKSEAQLSNALKIALAGHWEYDVAGDMFTFNDNFYRIFRTTAEEVGGYEMSSADYASKFCHPDDAALVGEEVKAAIETQDPDYSRYVEHRIRYADGETGYIAVRFSIVKDAQGHTVRTFGVNQDITDRVKTERVNQERQRYLESVMSSAPDAIITLDRQHRIVDWNTGAEKLYGYQKQEVIGKDLDPLITREENLGEAIGFTELVSKGETLLPTEAVRYRRGGLPVNVIIAGAPITIDGESTGSVSVYTDITKLKQAEERLKASEARYRLLAETAPDFIYIVNPDLTIQYMNTAAARPTGKAPEELIGKPVSSLFREGTSKIALIQLKRVFKTGRPVSFDERLIFAGEELWVNTQLVPIMENGGYISAVQGITRNITKRKQVEIAIKRERDRAQGYLDIAGVIFIALDAKGEVTLINKKGCEILGYPREEILGKNWFDHFLPKKEKAKVRAYFKRLMNEETQIRPHFENPVMSKKGEVRFISWNNTVIRNGERRATGTLSAGEDVTERNRALEALKDSEERLRVLFEFAPDAYYLTDMKGAFLDGNKAAEEMIGYKREELVGGSFLKLKLLSPAQLEKTAKLLAKNIRVQRTGPDEFTLNRKDGTKVQVEIVTFPVKIKGKRCVLGIARDISERKRIEETMRATEERIQQMQKLEALGTLAGGVAHDFNNILTPILGYTELALDEVAAGTTLHENLEEVLKASRRGKDLVNQILAFSRTKKSEKYPLDLSPILKEALKMLQPTLSEKIEVRNNITSNSLVMADPTQAHQVIINLLCNAVDAMKPGGGILEVGLSDFEVLEEDRKHLSELKTGAYIKLSVQDTGCGMDEAIRKKIFDPFFTTKKPGKGTGMGLSVVMGIVKEHGGWITVYSEPGMGSTFNVYLPKAGGDAKKKEEQGAVLPSGNERILLVDDEVSIAKLSRKVLESLGYKVTALTDPSESYKVFLRRPRSFDLLIADVIMPEMPGDVLAGEILQIRPEMPVILCSGYSGRVSEERVLAMGIRAILVKPVMKRVLAETVRRVLDEAKKEVQNGPNPDHRR